MAFADVDLNAIRNQLKEQSGKLGELRRHL
jgi:hypothetical protein